MIRAENLHKTDWLGKSDPYVNLTLGKVKQHTKTINNTLNPVWNEKFNVSHGGLHCTGLWTSTCTCTWIVDVICVFL